MSSFIVIREFRPNDKIKCIEILKETIVETSSVAFMSMLTREITFELIVLTAAIMFIFVGVPFTFCLSAVPLVILFIYFSIYSTLWIKAVEKSQSFRPSYCWVAEACEPYFFAQKPQDTAYTVLTEKEANFKNIDTGSYQRKIVGFVSIDTHRVRDTSVWLSYLAVSSSYRRKGVGSTLVFSALRQCESERHVSMELVTTECQDPARQLFVNSGFQIKQIYHRKLFVDSLQMYQLFIELKPTLYSY